MAESKQRLIEAPTENLLTEDEVARELRVSTKTLSRLIESGEFPEGMQNSDRGRVWGWRDVVWFTLGMELQLRLKDRKGQEGTQGTHKGTTAKRDE